MKRTLLLILTVICSISLLFANGASETSKKADEKTVVTVWTNDRHDLSYVEKKVAEFNAANERIEIQLQTVVEDYPNMIVMGYSSGNAPDIFSISARSTGFDLKTFVEAGMLLPLTDLMNDPEFEKVTDASKNVIEGINAIDGVPYSFYTAVRSGSKMIYNKSLLEASGITELPKTLEELVQIADKITKDGNGKYYGIATCSSAQLERWLEGCINRGGVYHYDYVNGVFDFSGFKPYMELAQKFFSNGSMFPGSNSQGVDAMRAQFANGTFAIWGNASQEAGVFTSQFPIKDFEWVVGELPTLDGQTHGAVEARLQKGYCIMSSTKNKDAAIEVIKYFSSEEFVKGYNESGFALPLSEYMRNTVDMSKIGRLADFAIQDYEMMYPAAPAVSVAGDNYAKTIWNCIVSGSDIDDCLNDLNKRYNDALEKDIKLGKVKRLVIKDYNKLQPNAGHSEYLTK